MMLAMSTEQITYLGGLIVSILLAIMTLILVLVLKRKENRNGFNSDKTNGGVWAFTKRHLPMYSFVFCLVLVIAFAALLITS